jgi:hypothetical protein
VVAAALDFEAFLPHFFAVAAGFAIKMSLASASQSITSFPRNSDVFGKQDAER